MAWRIEVTKTEIESWRMELSDEVPEGRAEC